MSDNDMISACNYGPEVAVTTNSGHRGAAVTPSSSFSPLPLLLPPMGGAGAILAYAATIHEWDTGDG